jgi:hypothetical protein
VAWPQRDLGRPTTPSGIVCFSALPMPAMHTSTRCIVTHVLFAAVLCVAAGCSSQELYGTGQTWQRNECQRIQDLQERKRCMERAALSHEEYQKEAAAAKGSK